MTGPRPGVARFGVLPDGRAVPAVTLVSDAGLSATVIGWGAALQSLIVPGDAGPVDVVLGFATLDGYLAHPDYFGATVGRFANRIAGGRFTLDGRDYRLPVNDGANSLHGGARGFDKRLWSVVAATPAAVTLRHVSADGEEGYPGTLTAEATYALDGAALTIAYRATSDAPTIVNLTNHSYWNLAGEGAADGAMGHLVAILADHFLPTDAGAIPLGEVRRVDGSVFDFRSPTAVGARVRDAAEPQIVIGRGYDHCWVMPPAAAPRRIASVAEPRSGRGFDLVSDAPGLQFYSGNFLDGRAAGKTRRLYRAGDGLVFEPQRLPDTPNRPAFGSARLAAGEVYRNAMTYQLRW